MRFTMCNTCIKTALLPIVGALAAFFPNEPDDAERDVLGAMHDILEAMVPPPVALRPTTPLSPLERAHRRVERALALEAASETIDRTHNRLSTERLLELGHRCRELNEIFEVASKNVLAYLAERAIGGDEVAREGLTVKEDDGKTHGIEVHTIDLDKMFAQRDAGAPGPH
jgi:hypothetical protein